MKVEFVGQDAERMVFTTTGGATLNSGVTDVTLRCTVSLDILFLGYGLTVPVIIVWSFHP